MKKQVVGILITIVLLITGIVSILNGVFTESSYEDNIEESKGAVPNSMIAGVIICAILLTIMEVIIFIGGKKSENL